MTSLYCQKIINNKDMSCERADSIADLLEEDALARAYRLFVERVYQEVEGLVKTGNLPSGRKVIASLSSVDLLNIFGCDELIFNEVLIKFLRDFNQYFLEKGWHGEFGGDASQGLELCLIPLSS